MLLEQPYNPFKEPEKKQTLFSRLQLISRQKLQILKERRELKRQSKFIATHQPTLMVNNDPNALSNYHSRPALYGLPLVLPLETFHLPYSICVHINYPCEHHQNPKPISNFPQSSCDASPQIMYNNKNQYIEEMITNQPLVYNRNNQDDQFTTVQSIESFRNRDINYGRQLCSRDLSISTQWSHSQCNLY